MQLLDSINSLDDLRKLNVYELPKLADEIRSLIIETVSVNGGHLASNLGMVDVTIALLRVFDPPLDKILFDVSHQSYAYKILTGRRDAFKSLRKTGGISGFLKRSESEFDAFGAGHAGTSISAALGFAAERDRRGGKEAVVAVVGDAAISNGISVEALNNVRDTTNNLIVVLNDNNMSISRNVGALSHAFGRMLGNPRYNRVKSAIEEVGIRHLRLSWLRKTYHSLESRIKSIFLPNAPFENMGIRYIGPINGHNIRQLIDAFESAKEAALPVLVHVGTTKGCGYLPAEQNPENWHSSNPFDIETGVRKNGGSEGIPWSDAFGKELTKLAETNDQIVAVTAAMGSGTGLAPFEKNFSDRFFDVGICESHQMTFAAGLAAAGLRPVVAVYSTFAQRSIDGVIHDIALQKLPVVICLDRAGVVPGDGPTHHGVFDIALMRPIPNTVIMQPRTAAALARMLRTAITLPYPVVIRYPRSNAPFADDHDDGVSIPIGSARILESAESPEVAIWTLGPEDDFAQKTAAILAKAGIASVRVDARFAKPIDEKLLLAQANAGVKVFLTLEDGIATGGFGSAVEEFLDSQPGVDAKVIRFGWPDKFLPHATSKSDLMEYCGLTPEAAAARIIEIISGK